MKFASLASAVAAAFALSAAPAMALGLDGTLDFNLPSGNMIDPAATDCAVSANGGLRCGQPQTFVHSSGVTVLATAGGTGTSVSQDFIAAGTAGLGVFTNTVPVQPSNLSDDAIQMGETLTLKFTTGALDITQITFSDDATHSGSFPGGAFAFYNAGAGDVMFSLNSPLTFAPHTFITDEITFKYGNDAFYVTTITAVPEPGTYALMAAGLGALGFMARRRKQA